jgi:nitroimidazol reductase NimA-like FMN-containing flavoprotein (pyridoxamine 5'-phosphate oxidase superfamily)
MKIIQATSEIPGMTKEEVDKFLEMKLNLQLATIDEQGWPNIHPVWFFYDKADERFLLTTGKLAKKTKIFGINHSSIFPSTTRILLQRESRIGEL